MWVAGFMILLLAWVFSFRILPEGVAQGGSGAYYVPIRAENAMETFVRISLWNLCAGCVP